MRGAMYSMGVGKSAASTVDASRYKKTHLGIGELTLHASNLTNSNTFAEVVDATTPAHKQREKDEW